MNSVFVSYNAFVINVTFFAALTLILAETIKVDENFHQAVWWLSTRLLVTPLLIHWSYRSLALSQRVNTCTKIQLKILLLKYSLCIFRCYDQVPGLAELVRTPCAAVRAVCDGHWPAGRYHHGQSQLPGHCRGGQELGGGALQSGGSYQTVSDIVQRVGGGEEPFNLVDRINSEWYSEKSWWGGAIHSGWPYQTVSDTVQRVWGRSHSIWSTISNSDWYSAKSWGGAWCCQATSHYLSHYHSPRSMSPHNVTRPHWVKKVNFIHLLTKDAHFLATRASYRIFIASFNFWLFILIPHSSFLPSFLGLPPRRSWRTTASFWRTSSRTRSTSMSVSSPWCTTWRVTAATPTVYYSCPFSRPLLTSGIPTYNCQWY